MPFAPFVFGAFILFVGYDILWKGIRSLVKFNFSSITLLMTIAVVAAFFLGEYPEAAVVIVLYELSERLESIGIFNSKTAINALVDKAPKLATLSDDKQVSIDKVNIGSVIRVKPGEMIPLDGEIIQGDSSVDEATITGEPIPKDKHTGDNVFAGTLNQQGFLEIKTTRLSKDTTFSKIVRLTFEAQANRSETQKFIQKFSKIYTPIIIVLAILVFIIPVVFLDGDSDQWLLQAITLLVIACPCALVISTPVAIYAAIGNASSAGALVKGGKFLEAIGKVHIVALDKTRTITHGKPIVSDILPLNVRDKEELLACAAGAELFSEHPLAEAIVEASKREGFKPHKVHKFESVSGKGAKAECLVCEDETIFVGKLDFIREHQPVTEEAEKIVEKLSDEGKTSVVISFGDGVAGVLGLTDQIKQDSEKVIRELKQLQVEPVILTGDHPNAASFVGNTIGISKVFGGLLPEQKAEQIGQLQKTGKLVAMVGDGINDAPALAKSNIGIAMGAAGSDIAIEVADIALMNDRLSLIPFLVRLGRATIQRIKINTIAAILIKVIFVVLAFLGYSNLVMAIGADVGVTIIVILTSLQLMKFR
jgi:Cd2+/Zn2+-exporting ATPase